MKEQILALAVQSGFKLDWAISNCTGQFESFYHAAIESYKAELLKEAGEPVGLVTFVDGECYAELSDTAKLVEFDELFTSDQLATAILKATGPLEKEIERLKTVPMKYRRMAFNAQLQDENNELRTQLAAAQEEIANGTAWQPIETAPKDGTWIVVTSTHNKYYRACVQFYDGNWCDTREVTHDDLMENAATHWMPMPKAPNGASPPPSS